MSLYDAPQDSAWSPPEAVCPTGAGTECNFVGRGFKLSDTVIDPRTMRNQGKPIFTLPNYQFGGQCVNGGPWTGSIDQNSTHVYTDTAKYVGSLNTSTDANASFTGAKFSAKATAKATTGEDVTTTSNLNVAEADYNHYSGNVQFDKRCYTKAMLDPTVAARFEELPVKSGLKQYDVMNPADFVKYKKFLDDFGSHVAESVDIGHRFNQIRSLASSSSDIARTLEVQACLDINASFAAGDAAGGGCTNINQSERKTAASTSSNKNRRVWGGDPNLTPKISDPGYAPSQEEIQQFIASSPMYDDAIDFHFEPIWTVLSTIYSNEKVALRAQRAPSHMLRLTDDNLQRANTLQAVYEMILAGKCSDYTSAGIIVPKVYSVQSDGSNPVYGCWMRYDGAGSEGDCNYSWGKACAVCNGGGCFTSEKGMPKKWNGADSGGCFDGANQGCVGPCNIFNGKCNKKGDGTIPGGMPDRWSYIQGEGDKYPN